MEVNTNVNYFTYGYYGGDHCVEDMRWRGNGDPDQNAVLCVKDQYLA